MNPTTSRLVAAGVLFLLTIITGMILSRSDRPLNIGLVTVHKLIAAGAMVLLGMAINQLFRAPADRTMIEISLITISGMAFLGLIATGALLTRGEMELPSVVLDIHRIGPLLALASSIVPAYILLTE